MNNLEKLINDLSNYWDLSPEKVVDRLNHMNESEIKNVVNKMTKKFKRGGFFDKIPQGNYTNSDPAYYNGPRPKFETGGVVDCLREGGKYSECKRCGGKVPIKKAESGTSVSRKSMFDSAFTYAPEIFDDKQDVRQAYRTAKRIGREQGLRGRKLRNFGRQSVINRAQAYYDIRNDNRKKMYDIAKSRLSAPVLPQLPVLDDVVIEDEPITINDNLFSNLDTSMPTVQKIDKFGGSFNSAFAARRSKLNEFEWNGKRYTTELGPEKTDTQGADVDYGKIVESSANYNPGSMTQPAYNTLYNIGAR